MKSPQEIKEELTTVLGREPSCSLLKDGRFMADFFKYGAKPTEFIADNEDDAYLKLLNYLKQKTDETVR